MAATAGAIGGRAMVNIYNGARKPFTDRTLIRVIDGNQNTISAAFHNTASAFFSGLPLYNNQGDNYRVLASADGCQDAGFFPVKMAQGVVQTVDLMLLPKQNQLNFANATWARLDARPKLKALFAKGADATTAANRYSDLEDRDAGFRLGCLLNITTAMDQILLPKGTPLDYMKSVIWQYDGPDALAQDRFFGWADPALIDQVKTATLHGLFAPAPATLHAGATSSWKQIQFGEANVQLTFHENDRLMIDGVNCVKIEPDIDYYQDPGAHLLIEVAYNTLGHLTDPRSVYVLRWIAGQRAGIPEFDPLYTIEKA